MTPAQARPSWPRTLRAHPGLMAGIGSGLLLVGALAFQYIGGLHPCILCLWQRAPHAVAVGAMLWLWARHTRPDAVLAVLVGLVAMVASLGLAGLHTGVELGMWPSPVGCGMPDWSDPQLAQQLSTTTPADCSQPAWSFLGHSMAGWNTLFSAVLLGMWAANLRHLLSAAPRD